MELSAAAKHKALWRAPPAELTYNNILYFLEELENGALEKRCNENDLFEINLFMVRLAQQGLLPNDDEGPNELITDAEDLFSEDYTSFKYDTNRQGLYEFQPAIYLGISKAEIKQVGLKKAWKKTKRWCKKHKKAIIIGTIVVATVAVVVTVVVVTGGAAAAGGAAASTKVGGAAAGGAAASAEVGGTAAAGAAAVTGSLLAKEKKSSDQSSKEEPAQSIEEAEQNRPQIATIISERCDEMKGAIQDVAIADDMKVLEEAGRFYGAATAELAYRDGAIEAQTNPELAREMGLDPSDTEGYNGKCNKAIDDIHASFDLQQASVTPLGAGLAAVRVMATRIPVRSPATAIAAAGVAVGTAAVVAANPSGAQKAYDTVCDGANYLYNKATQSANDVKDYVTSSVSGWFEGFPDRPLPRDERTKEPVGDIEGVPHTQLGARDSKSGRGKYRQAREFDADGNEIRRIDFTDHDKPQNHTNPHQHCPKPNKTGGTPEGGKAEPVPEWTYDE